MSISYLSLHGVRNLKDVSLDFHEHFNFFIGSNGSGKTSLLETIYLLGTSRSFRTHLYRKVVNYDEHSLTVFGRLKEGDSLVQIGVQKDRHGDTKIKINQEPCRQSAHLAKILPLQLYYSDSFQVIDSAPKIRREILDWGVFHVKHDYFKLWAHYQKVLKQRNAWLRGVDEFGGNLKWSLRQEPCPWNILLSDYADKVHLMRQEYFQEFVLIFQNIIKDFFQIPITIAYFKGWGSANNKKVDFNDNASSSLSSSDSLLCYLEKDTERDKKIGYTHHGAHKADIYIRIEQGDVKDLFSRGQQKLVVIAIKLAQGILLSRLVNKDCVYLMDDICAEFDQDNLSVVMNYFAKIPGQVFFTGTNEKAYNFSSLLNNAKVFHVKHGKIT
jgi:DNA replication and repair protein RecF